jgi:hypothetical protein
VALQREWVQVGVSDRLQKRNMRPLLVLGFMMLIARAFHEGAPFTCRSRLMACRWPLTDVTSHPLNLSDLGYPAKRRYRF